MEDKIKEYYEMYKNRTKYYHPFAMVLEGKLKTLPAESVWEFITYLSNIDINYVSKSFLRELYCACAECIYDFSGMSPENQSLYDKIEYKIGRPNNWKKHKNKQNKKNKKLREYLIDFNDKCNFMPIPILKVIIIPYLMM